VLHPFKKTTQATLAKNPASAKMREVKLLEAAGLEADIRVRRAA